MYNIAVLDFRFSPDIQDEIQKLARNTVKFWPDRCPEDERITRTADAEIVLITSWEKIDTAYLDACPQLKYIGLCGTSTANIDLEELDRRGIAFSNIVSHDKGHVAEFFFMQMAYLARGMGTYQWKPGGEHELAGKRIGIIGLGDVGKALAHLALAYNMRVSYFSPHRKHDWEDKGLTYLEKGDLLESSDIVALCSPTNVKVMDKPEFQTIKSGSILLQTCSGSPFDKTAFLNWIAQDGNFAIFDMSAGVDNYRAYSHIPRVVFSKVVAGDTQESNQRRGRRAVENLQLYLKNHPL